MELIVPFLLLVVGWNPADPDASMVVQTSLHANEQVCTAAGQAFVDSRQWMRSYDPPAAYKFFCIAAPGPDEYNGVAGQGE